MLGPPNRCCFRQLSVLQCNESSVGPVNECAALWTPLNVPIREQSLWLKDEKRKDGTCRPISWDHRGSTGTKNFNQVEDVMTTTLGPRVLLVSTFPGRLQLPSCHGTSVVPNGSQSAYGLMGPAPSRNKADPALHDA